MKKLLVLIPCLLQLQSCSDADATSPELQMEYEILHEFSYNEYANTTSKNTTLITAQNDYESELLKRSTDTAQTVDFETESVLLIDMGLQSSGGYNLSVTFTEADEYILANIVYKFPGNNCGVTTAVTNPSKFIKLESTKYILISEEISYPDC